MNEFLLTSKLNLPWHSLKLRPLSRSVVAKEMGPPPALMAVTPGPTPPGRALGSGSYWQVPPPLAGPAPIGGSRSRDLCRPGACRGAPHPRRARLVPPPAPPPGFAIGRGDAEPDADWLAGQGRERPREQRVRQRGGRGGGG